MTPSLEFLALSHFNFRFVRRINRANTADNSNPILPQGFGSHAANVQFFLSKRLFALIAQFSAQKF